MVAILNFMAVKILPKRSRVLWDLEHQSSPKYGSTEHCVITAVRP